MIMPLVIILLSFLVILFSFKHLIFLFMLLPIKYIHRKRSKKALNINSDSIDTDLTQNINYTSFRSKIVNLINGYIRYFIIKTGYLPSHRVRKFIYKNILYADLKDKTVIYFGAEIRAPFNLKIGNSIIGDKVILDARNGIEIGDNVNFSSNVSIWTEQHDHRDPMFKCNSDKTFKVVIKDRVWIGPNATILHGVNIGEGAVVAAGAIVTKDVNDYTIVAGIPAKPIGQRNKDLRYNFTGDHLPFY